MSAANAAKAPPRKAAPRKAAQGAQVAQAANTPSELRERRAAGLNGLAQLAQGVCLMTGQYADAMTLGRYFPPVASELATIADEYESVAKPIDVLIKVGPFGALIAAAMPLVMQLLANHKVIDANAAIGQGVVPPQVLEAQMKAEMARMQAEAMREQQMAMRDAEKAQADYESMMAAERADEVARVAA